MNTSNYNELMKELRTEYLESFENKFELLRNFFDQAEWYNIELEYHKLKGTGATYGAPEITILCRELERICHNRKSIEKDTLDLSIELLKKIKEKYLDQVEFELEKHPGFLKLKGL